MHQVIASSSRRPWSWRWYAAILSLLAVAAALRSIHIVDEAETVYLTEFGRPVRLIREPGLYLKWPHHARRSFDKRLQVHSPPPREMLTRDKKNLEVAWYLTWRIDQVDRFLKSVRTIPDASARLEDMAASVIAAELGGHDLSDLVRIGKPSGIGAMMDEVTRRIGEQAAQEYGVAVSDCRLRRLNFPEEVRSAVFEQIRSERHKVAAVTRAEGESSPDHPECRRSPVCATDRRGAGRGGQAGRPGRSRGSPNRERGPGSRSGVLPVPQDARDLSHGPRSEDDPCPFG